MKYWLLTVASEMGVSNVVTEDGPTEWLSARHLRAGCPIYVVLFAIQITPAQREALLDTYWRSAPIRMPSREIG